MTFSFGMGGTLRQGVSDAGVSEETKADVTMD
jgi:hypothetical protein